MADKNEYNKINYRNTSTNTYKKGCTNQDAAFFVSLPKSDFIGLRISFRSRCKSRPWLGSGFYDR